MASRQWDRSTWVADKGGHRRPLRQARPGQWAKAFEDVDACVTRVNTLGGVTTDPHIRNALGADQGRRGTCARPRRPRLSPPRCSPSRPALRSTATRQRRCGALDR